MDRLSKRDWLVVAFFAFVTLGTALVILYWLLGWYYQATQPFFDWIPLQIAKRALTRPPRMAGISE